VSRPAHRRARCASGSPIRTLPEGTERFRVATVGAGAANLFVTMQLHELSSLDAVISRLTAEYPGVTVLDTRVVLRSVKSWGRLLGPDGRAEDVVRVDLWAPANRWGRNASSDQIHRVIDFGGRRNHRSLSMAPDSPRAPRPVQLQRENMMF
jgi:hypothetical protein